MEAKNQIKIGDMVQVCDPETAQLGEPLRVLMFVKHSDNARQASIALLSQNTWSPIANLQKVEIRDSDDLANYIRDVMFNGRTASLNSFWVEHRTVLERIRKPLLRKAWKELQDMDALLPVNLKRLGPNDPFYWRSFR